MRMFFFKWSRKLHKWLGIYVAILTLVWVVELVLLPYMYSTQEGQADVVQMEQGAAMQVRPIQFEELYQRIDSGVYGAFGSDVEISYLPLERKYIVRDRESFAVCEISAESGVPLARQIDTNTLFAEKSGLAWASEGLSTVIKAPFEVSFIVLSISGVYLIVFPYLPRRQTLGQGLLSLAPGDCFRFMGTREQKDMARMAALGLLPGVRATIMRNPRRGALVVSARNTRIAVARNIATSFLFEKVVA